jgi:HSP20 family protein
MTRITLPRTIPLFGNMSREMDEMTNRMRRFLKEPYAMEPLPLAEPVGWVPAVEITENAEEIVLTAELPGMKAENLEVLFEEDVLTIRGEKKEEKKEEKDDRKFHVWERSYGAFQRNFTLPRTIVGAKIAAEFKDGLLTVRLPKSAAAAPNGRKIEIATK